MPRDIRSYNPSSKNLRLLGLSLRRWIRIPYRLIPKAYWRRRHRRHGHSLEGVGQIGLGDLENERDYVAKWKQVNDLLNHFGVTPDCEVIDAGCGVGWFTERLTERGHKVHAIDFSPEAIALAQERLGERATFEVGALDTWSASNNADLVICIDVLFHVVDQRRWRRALEALINATAPLGLLLIQEHLATAAKMDSPSHVRWRTLSDYLLALEPMTLLEHRRYLLPESGTEKDIMVWQKPASR